MLSTSKGANFTESANRVEVTFEPRRAAQQRLRAVGIEPATTELPLAVVMRAAVTGIAIALHALSASAQSARDVKGPLTVQEFVRKNAAAFTAAAKAKEA